MIGIPFVILKGARISPNRGLRKACRKFAAKSAN